MQLIMIFSDLGVNRVVGRGASNAVSLFRDSAGHHPVAGCKNTANNRPQNSHPDQFYVPHCRSS